MYNHFFIGSQRVRLLYCQSRRNIVLRRIDTMSVSSSLGEIAMTEAGYDDCIKSRVAPLRGQSRSPGCIAKKQSVVRWSATDLSFEHSRIPPVDPCVGSRRPRRRRNAFHNRMQNLDALGHTPSRSPGRNTHSLDGLHDQTII